MLNTGVRDMPMETLVLATAVLLCSIIGTTHAATNKARLCFKGSEADPNGNITLACPESQIITIDEALFARSKYLLCVISDGDCVEKTKIFQECESRNNCSRSFKTYSTKCGYASVMFISYTCLPVDPVSVYTSMYATVSTKKADISEGSQVHDSEKSSGLVSKESGSLTETGLIAGCVVAAVITVIFLVIAITMVVRRLTQKNNPDDDDDGDDVEADTIKSKKQTCCATPNCFSHIKNSFSYHEKKHDFKAAKILSDAAVVRTNKQSSVNHKLSAEVTKNSLDFEDTKGQVSSDDRNANIQSDVEDDQLDSNSNSRLKHIAKENAGRNNGSENSPLVTGVNNEDITSMNKLQNSMNKQQDSMNKQQDSMVSDNSFSEMAEDAQEENVASQRIKLNSTAACLSEGQETPAESNDQTHSAKHPMYDAVSIPNTQKGTIC